MAHDDDSAAGGDDRPATRGKRFFKLATMTASVAGRYASTTLRSAFQSPEKRAEERAASHRRSGEEIAETLGQLKGAAMKLGQMASVGSDLLPKELADALVKLQKEAPPMPVAVIREQIEAEFGAPPETLFSHFEDRPFAAASIGQVHRGRTDDGREVVVKVQYPGVDASVDSDLNHLHLALRASGLVNRVHRAALADVFEELRARLHEELDYTIEADNLRIFRNFHKKHDFLVIPDVVGERSSKRVLTLTFEPGHSVTELVREGWSQDTKDTIGRNIVRMLVAQIFDLQTVHADPNPGNFAFHEDGRIVIYDFGCVKEVKAEVLAAWRDLVASGIRDDYEGVERGLRSLKARNLEVSALPDGYYKGWRDILVQPFRADLQPYDFAAARLREQLVEKKMDALRHIAAFQPPVELVFLDRAIAGHYGTLKALGARGDYFPEIAEAFGLRRDEAPR